MNEVITIKVDQGGETKQVSLENGMYYLWHPINGEMRPIGMFEYGVTLRIEGNTFLRNCIFKTGPSRKRAEITLREVTALNSTFQGNCLVATETVTSLVSWSYLSETEIVAGEAKIEDSKITEAQALAKRINVFNSTIHFCDLSANTIHLLHTQLSHYEGETGDLGLSDSNLHFKTKKRVPRVVISASTSEWVLLDTADFERGDHLLIFDMMDGRGMEAVQVFKSLGKKNVRLIVYKGQRHERPEMIWPRGSFEHEYFCRQVERLEI